MMSAPTARSTLRTCTGPLIGPCAGTVSDAQRAGRHDQCQQSEVMTSKVERLALQQREGGDDASGTRGRSSRAPDALWAISPASSSRLHFLPP